MDKVKETSLVASPGMEPVSDDAADPKPGSLGVVSLPSLSLGAPTAALSWLHPDRGPARGMHMQTSAFQETSKLLPWGWFQ